MTAETSAKWIRLLALLALLGFVLKSSPLFSFFFAFGAFSGWGSTQPWLRAISYLGFLGFFGLLGFVV